jgi:hypothetical protein
MSEEFLSTSGALGAKSVAEEATKYAFNNASMDSFGSLSTPTSNLASATSGLYNSEVANYGLGTGTEYAYKGYTGDFGDLSYPESNTKDPFNWKKLASGIGKGLGAFTGVTPVAPAELPEPTPLYGVGMAGTGAEGSMSWNVPYLNENMQNNINKMAENYRVYLRSLAERTT